MSYTWKSIWLARKVIQDDFGWRVDNEVNISIFNHAWILGSISYKLLVPIINSNLFSVAELIDASTRSWNKEIITKVFDPVDTERILRILLAKIPHEDKLIWRGKALGEAPINYYNLVFLLLMLIIQTKIVEISISNYGD